MNREILFRGKRLDNSEWVYGFFWKDIWRDGESCYIHYGCEEYPIYPDTVDRYTGLADKNGKKIFEGDIVEAEDGIIDESFRFQVCFGICGGTQNVLHEVGYMGFYLQPVGETAKKYVCLGLRNDIVFWVKQKDGITVIGNIHDNPELLEAHHD